MRTEPACSGNPGDPGARDAVGVLARAIAGLTALACRLPWLVVAFTVATCAASIFYALGNLTYQTQRSDLIDKQKGFYQRWQRYLAEFGDDDDMIVVVRGESKQRLRQAIDDRWERNEEALRYLADR